MEILLGGDLVPTKSNMVFFNNGDIENLLGRELAKIWMGADCRIFNLESPLLDVEMPISKCGPNLRIPTCSIEGISALKPSLVTLANNHILDHGPDGLDCTENLLKMKKISYIGAGKNLIQASRPIIIELNNYKIGVYACAEHEFSIATQNFPGVNPFEPLESLDHIAHLKERSDYVIVLYHGGIEHYRYPSPNLQKVCKKIVEKGADLVITQHSHCVGSFEEYCDSTIVYGQGNFIFDYDDNQYWNTSLIVKVDICDSFQVSFIPIVKDSNTIRKANCQETHIILKDFYDRSEQIKSEDFVKKTYNKFCLDKIYSYLSFLNGMSRSVSKIDKRLFHNLIIKRRYTKKKLLAILNYIECEAHSELVLTGLKLLMRD